MFSFNPIPLEWEGWAWLTFVFHNLRKLSHASSFILGGRQRNEETDTNESIKQVVKFDKSLENQWQVTGELNFARNYHAVDIVNNDDVLPYCLAK